MKRFLFSTCVFIGLMPFFFVEASSKIPWEKRLFSVPSNSTCTGAPFDGQVIIPSKMKIWALANEPIEVYVKDQRGRVVTSSYSSGQMIQLSFVSIEPFYVLVCRNFARQRNQKEEQNYGPPIGAYLSSN